MGLLCGALSWGSLPLNQLFVWLRGLRACSGLGLVLPYRWRSKDRWARALEQASPAFAAIADYTYRLEEILLEVRNAGYLVNCWILIRWRGYNVCWLVLCGIHGSMGGLTIRVLALTGNRFMNNGTGWMQSLGWCTLLSSLPQQVHRGMCRLNCPFASLRVYVH